MTHDVGPAFLVFGHADVEGGLGRRRGLLPSFFCHWSSFRLFSLIILGGRSTHMTTSMFMFAENGSLSSFIWGLSTNFNRPSFMAD
jgi:hypothetical protein